MTSKKKTKKSTTAAKPALQVKETTYKALEYTFNAGNAKEETYFLKLGWDEGNENTDRVTFEAPCGSSTVFNRENLKQLVADLLPRL